MTLALVLGFAVIFQLIAAVMAARLICLTGNRLSWGLISLALVFMAIRRIIPFYDLAFGDQSMVLNTTNEIVGLVISILMMVGVIGIAPLFSSIKRTKKMLLQVVSGSPIPAFLIGKDHKVIYWNLALQKYSGISSKEMVGTNQHWKAFYSKERPCMVDLLIDDTIEQFPQWYSGKYKKSEMVEGGYEGTDFFPSLGKEGTWLHFTAVAIRDSQGNITGALETLEDITERKQTEEALQKSEEKYRAVADFTYDWESWIDSGGKFIYVSPSCKRMTGYMADEFINDFTLYTKIVHPDDRPTVEKHLEGVLTGNVAVDHMDFRIITRNGKERWIGHMSQSVFGPDGQWLGQRISDRDITERKRAEEALRLASVYNRNLIETSIDPLVTIGQDGKITDVNTATELATGCSRDELIGTDFSMYFSDPGKAKAGYEKVFKEGRVRDYDLELKNKDGGSISVLYNAAVYKDEAGNVLGVFAAARDITERKKAEEALRLAGVYNRNLIETSIDPLVTIGQDGKITDVNTATELATGCSRDELIGTDFSLYFTEPKKAKAGYERVFREGRVRDYDLELKNKDGRTLSVLYNAAVYKDEAGNVLGVFAAARDISKRKKAEDALQKAHDELESKVEERTRELKEKDEHLAVINRILRHDVLNHQVVIDSALKLYEEEQDKRFLGEISDRLNKTISLIHQMRDVEASLASGHNLQPHEVADVIVKVMESYPFIDFTLKGSGQALIDDALHSVIDNIIRNAIHHGNTTKIDVFMEDKDGFCEIRIADYGVGIPDEIKSRIFAEGFKFGQSKGSGLGLYIVGKTIERYGGTVHVEDNKPQGTVFVLRLKKAK